MPTITCTLTDLNQLAGTAMSVSELERRILLVKGELKGYDAATDELKLELQDTNRPDLWTVEGISRQLRFIEHGPSERYRLLTEQTFPVTGEMIIDGDLAFRPFAGAFIVRDLDVTDAFLIGMIQTQEKLANNLGRNRKTLSIGIYDLDQITFPVYYKSVGRHDNAFVPLEFDSTMTPDEILKKHPKGVAYASILENQPHVPLLVDHAGCVMSFPPIINSRESGEVKIGRRNLFIEATGTNFMQMVLALNIFAADMMDRSGAIEGVQVRYPFETPLGSTVLMPAAVIRRNEVDMSMIREWLGIDPGLEETSRLLLHYGYQIEKTDHQNGSLAVAMPSWRQDLLHPVDIIEDVAIAKGYDSFIPEMPTYFTVGKVDPGTAFEDRIRNIILAFGYEEVISNILCDRSEFTDMVREPDRAIVEIANPMNIKFAALRDRILPSLLRVERDSSQAQYPHRMFETGEVTVLDPSSVTGCRTRIRLAVLIADKEAEFSHVHSCLESLLFSLGLSSVLKQEDAPVFLNGRSARITIGNRPFGWIGEIHPETLENFNITMPCAGFELDLDMLRDYLVSPQS